MTKNVFINDLPQLMKRLIAGQVVLTSKVLDRFAGMTIAWGFFGNMWNQLYFTAAVRPSRHTFSVLHLTHSFTVNFFDEGYEKELHYFGSISGYQENKFTNDSLHIDLPLLSHFTAPIVEAKYVIECKVRDTHPINAYQIQSQTDTLKFYPQNNDYHIMIYGKIEEMVKRV